ncbi:GtrA family protein [Shinella sp. NM-101]|uniref:GtrA family protein n=1 Tax=Shinella sp. NM-101 TaxID=2744455 RepID=UPI001F467D68|nr:GtrA family protein [Shinella sp. NM-101]
MPNLPKICSILKNFLVFSGGSVVGAIIDYVVTLGANGLLGTPPSLALAASMVASGSIVFLYHDRITFRTSGTGWVKRYVKFMMLTAIILALRVVVLELFIAAGLPVFIAVALAIGIVSVANFAASSMLVFMKGSK